ncbi:MULTISPECIES: FAD-dependent oxidoreductase [unclassified Leptolyngbya]|uniref:FAD-dependent oxidoreductase n=1 Tax=unclassified Leptolyngbya TaxID=2650499 RepID=UPI001688490D|nr:MULTISPECIES: FAD-dependent oxidoreductase [unclassified Leptolyngbya]MBD1913968.1 FAD-dependent oxidoreductase [Leptolyngbya sp. FACHB-8]MBD2155935.1 FAD-dependent oxidoreductase [Leptolyngbya sp. FACHB-16]
MNCDYELLVIGAGSGGLAAAQRAASYGVKVAIAERFKPGGACVNYGCIPEKLLDHAASFRRLNHVAIHYGWGEDQRQFHWPEFVEAEEQHIDFLNALHQKHLEDAGVTLLRGQAYFADEHTVIINDQPVTADKILIAVGAKPCKPAIPGIEHTITWHELYYLKEQPKSVAVMGGDPIGVKICGSLNALGSQVTQIILEDRILPLLDEELIYVIQDRMQQHGVQLLTQRVVEKIEPISEGFALSLVGHSAPLIAASVLADTGRMPDTDGLQLENVGVKLASGMVQVDEFSRTHCPHIFAIGDCTGRMPLTPSAIVQGRIFADSEFGNHAKPVRLDLIPMSLSSHPEAATVGLSEAQARDRYGEAIACYRKHFRPLLYAITGLEERTFMKVVVNREDGDRILGIHMVGEGAVEIVQSLAVSLRLGATKQDLDATIGIHPSSAEELFSL